MIDTTRYFKRLQIQMTTEPIEEEEVHGNIWRTNLTIISICGGSNTTVEHKLKERDHETAETVLSTPRPSTQRAING